MSFLPDLAEGEAEGVIQFIKKYATDNRKRSFDIKVSDMSHLFIGAKDPIHHLNRIRWCMKEQFNNADIKFTLKGSSYRFELGESININPFESEPVSILDDSIIESELSDSFETSTNYEDDYIPPHYFPDVLTALKLGDKPLLVGPIGCGKSRCLEEAYKKLGRKIYRITLSQERDILSLIGTKEIVNIDGVPTTKMVGGVLTHALENGYGIIFDEYDLCDPSMVSSLNQIMEKGVEITLNTESGPYQFRPHPKTLIAATANTWGQGDITGFHSDAKEQNIAAMDRLRPKIPCDYDYSLEEIIVKKYLPKKIVEALYCNSPEPNKIGLVRKIRNAIADPNNPLYDKFSFRSIQWFAQRFKYYGWHKGLFYLIHDFREENRESIIKIIKDRFGLGLTPSNNDYDPNQPLYIPSLLKEKESIQMDL